MILVVAITSDMLIYLCQGDTKGSARGGDVSAKKELVGAQLTNPQVW